MEALSEFCWTIAAKIESVHLHIKTDDNKCNSNEIGQDFGRLKMHTRLE